MTLDQFKAAIQQTGLTITNISGDDKGLTLTLSNKRKIVAKRQRIKDAATDDELQAYVTELLA